MEFERSLNQDEAQTLLRKIRHDISSSISMLESSMRNISGPNSDADRALRVHGVGVEKLKAALEQFDSWIGLVAGESKESRGD